MFVEGAQATSTRTVVQGKPVVRRGRKAKGSRARRPGCRLKSVSGLSQKENIVKANLARFTLALMLLASMALTIGAGMRWDALSSLRAF